MVKKLLVCGLGLALGGCFQPMKPSEGHLRDQPAPPAASIPPPVQSLPAPPRPKPALKPETYTVVVNQVNVRELLFALARDAKVNVDIHPGITGTVTLNAFDQTLPQLLSRIAKQVDMRYELDGPNLVVMPDSPYLRIYKIDYVNMQRETKGQVSVAGMLEVENNEVVSLRPNLPIPFAMILGHINAISFLAQCSPEGFKEHFVPANEKHAHGSGLFAN